MIKAIQTVQPTQVSAQQATTQKGIFSQFADGTPIVKTDAGHVAILPMGDGTKKALSALQIGDSVSIYGTMTQLKETSPDAFSGSAIRASSITKTSSVKEPELQQFVGMITHLQGGQGHPGGNFLRLDTAVVLNGESYSLILLPGDFASHIGARAEFEGTVKPKTSPAGDKYLIFTEFKQPKIEDEFRDGATPSHSAF